MQISELKELIDEAKALLGLDENYCATSRVVSVGTFSEQATPTSSTGPGSVRRGRVVTVEAHDLFDFDQARVNFAASSTPTGRNAFMLRRAQEISTLSVVSVPSPQVVEVDVQSFQPQALEDSTVSLPLNMHKLAREVLIPMTTVQERILHLTDVQDVRKLFASLDPHTRVVTETLRLPGSNGTMVVAEKGMSIHGSLSRDGVVRRNYWSLGDRRCEWWKRKTEGAVFATGVESKREMQPALDRAPEGFAETEQWITREEVERRVSSIDGVYLVLRKGESWSESRGRARRITDFISHNWSGSCKDLVETLTVAKVRTAWICTLALNQHAIPSLSGDYCKSPFYQALEQMNGKGRMVMVLDRNATTLTRIWCIFEVWVSRSLRLKFQMFLPSGEVNFFGGGHECKYARKRIADLNLHNTEYSRREDYDMIMSNIENSPGGQEAVLWQVKRILSTSAIVLLARVVQDTSTFCFMLPFIWRSWYFSPFWLSPPLAPLIVVFGLHRLRAWRFFFSFTNFSAIFFGAACGDLQRGSASCTILLLPTKVHARMLERQQTLRGSVHLLGWCRDHFGRGPGATCDGRRFCVPKRL